MATVRLWVRAIPGRCGQGVCWAAPRTIFRRERRIQKVSTRECARARVRGRGGKQQQLTRQLSQKLESPFPTRKCAEAEPGGESEGGRAGRALLLGMRIVVPGTTLASGERLEWG